MKRAVIYCRVSTDEEIQLNALESQIEEAKHAVWERGWTLVDSYIDEGKSGTTTKHRDEYNRLVNDLSKDSMDIIVAKSQDRLMRNTKEWYLFVDQLVQSGKRLYFYLENKFYTPDDALITGIKAILAEEYSRDLSKKINNAHKNRQKLGKTVLLTSNTWGYDKIGKDVVVNEKEAEIVRLIYRLCLQGYGSRLISKELQNRGIKSRSGGKFQEATVRRIIRNPLFKGTAVMNKRHLDFNTKKTIQMPESEWAIHEGAVPPIVDEETWQQANDLMDERSKQLNRIDFSSPRQGLNLGKYEMSGKIVCGECGEVYWRRYRKNGKGERIVDWSCSEYVRRGRKNNDTRRGKDREKLKSEGGCDNIHLNDNMLMDALYDVAKVVSVDRKDEIVDSVMAILEEVLSDNGEEEISDLEQKKEKIMEKREILLDKSLDGFISDDLFRRKDASLEKEYLEVQRKISSIAENQEKRECKIDRLKRLQDEVTGMSNKEWSLRKLMEHVVKIVVYPDHADVIFDLFENVRINIERQGYKTSLYLFENTNL